MVIHFMTPKDLVVQYQKTPSQLQQEFPPLVFLSKDAQLFLMVMPTCTKCTTWVIYTVLHTMGTNKL